MTMEFNNNLKTAATVSGIIVRYAFYGLGALVFAIIAGIYYSPWNLVARHEAAIVAAKTDAAFQIGASEVSRRPLTVKAVSTPVGRAESLQFGQLYDRDTDMTALIVVPSEGRQTLTRDFNREIAELGALSRRRMAYPPVFYDLRTRFGDVRGAEFTIDADGRTKLCIAYLSRFDTQAIYVKGWYCEANGARPSFSAVACVLDKLKLAKPLQRDQADAQAFMDAATKRPASCSAEPVSQTTASGSSSSRQAPLKRLIR